MRVIYTTLIPLLLPALSMAHGGKDPVKELEINRSHLATAQDAFDWLASDQERIESLEKQASYLQNNILILRNILASDYPHVIAGMSKYKLDYMDVLDDSLKDFKVTLKQMKKTRPEWVVIIEILIDKLTEK